MGVYWRPTNNQCWVCVALIMILNYVTLILYFTDTSSCSTTKEPLCYSRVVIKLLRIMGGWGVWHYWFSSTWFEITLESWLDFRYFYLPYKELSITRLVIYGGKLYFTKIEICFYDSTFWNLEIPAVIPESINNIWNCVGPLMDGTQCSMIFRAHYYFTPHY